MLLMGKSTLSTGQFTRGLDERNILIDLWDFMDDMDDMNDMMIDIWDHMGFSGAYMMGNYGDSWGFRMDL
jgi:hypothetical protein